MYVYVEGKQAYLDYYFDHKSTLNHTNFFRYSCNNLAIGAHFFDPIKTLAKKFTRLDF